MAITLRKAGVRTPVIKAATTSLPAADAGYRSPFRESFHEQEAPKSAAVAAPVSPPAVTDPAKAKPKAVFKITPGRALRPGLPPASPAPLIDKSLPDAALVQAGLMEHQEIASLELYPPVMPGDFITVTNTLFAPFVKHYQPGDIARVMSSSATHSHPEDPVKYRAHFCEILEGPRKGQKCMLFRWEFEPRRNPVPPPRIEGRVITQT